MFNVNRWPRMITEPLRIDESLEFHCEKRFTIRKCWNASCFLHDNFMDQMMYWTIKNLHIDMGQHGWVLLIVYGHPFDRTSIGQPLRSCGANLILGIMAWHGNTDNPWSCRSGVFHCTCEYWNCAWLARCSKIVRSFTRWFHKQMS